MVSHWTSMCPSVHPSFRQSYSHLPIHISFPDCLSKHQWIFTKLGMCIDVVEIWFGTANGQISLNFDRFICRDTPIFSFPDHNLSKYQGILTKLGTCIVIKENWFGIANWQFLTVICPRHDNGGYYRFMFLFTHSKSLLSSIFIDC